MHHLNKADHFILERYNTVGIVFRFSFSLRFRSLVKHFLQATIISIAKITSRLYDIYRSNNLALKNSITIYFIDRANAIQRRDLVNWDFFFFIVATKLSWHSPFTRWRGVRPSFRRYCSPAITKICNTQRRSVILSCDSSRLESQNVHMYVVKLVLSHWCRWISLNNFTVQDLRKHGLPTINLPL